MVRGFNSLPKAGAIVDIDIVFFKCLICAIRLGNTHEWQSEKARGRHLYEDITSRPLEETGKFVRIKVEHPFTHRAISQQARQSPSKTILFT